MISQFAAAVAFLTRLPVPTRTVFEARDVGRSSRWFPLVGLLIGGLQIVGLLLFSPVFPPLLVAAFIVAIGAIATGALHLDGLADSADGFGGGATREDVLRIMRDHAIGSYGGVALSLAILAKTAAIATLIERGHALQWLLLAPAVGRMTAVILGATFRYARDSAMAISNFIGPLEATIAATTAAAIAIGLAGRRGLAACAAAATVAMLWGSYCKRRIGGITGDTLGASVEISEIAALLCGIAL